MIDKTNQLNEYTIQATLISGNRSLIISLVCLAAIIFLASIGLIFPAVVLMLAFVVLAIYRIMRPIGAGWHEQVQIVIKSDGLMIIRANGHSNFTEWDTFESVQLDELTFNDSDARSKSQYKLTFMNMYKPTVSSFIHTKTADNSIFLLPVEFAIELAQQEAAELHEMLASWVESGQKDKRPTPHQEPDLESLFKLKNCMLCLYSLKGLKRNGICPECGWEFDRSMFLVDGIMVKPRQSLILYVYLLIPISFAMLNASIAPSLILLIMALAISTITIVIPSIIGKKGPYKLLATDQGVQEWRGTKLTTKHAWENIGTLHSIEGEFSNTRIAFWLDKKQSVRMGSIFQTWKVRPMGKPVVDIILRSTPVNGRLIISELNRRWTSCSE